MEIRCCAKTRPVGWGWMALLMAVPGAVLGWLLGWWVLAVYLAAVPACAEGCWGWLRSFRLEVSDTQLSLSSGSWMNSTRRQPVGALCCVNTLQTPLLRLVRCGIAVLYSPGGMWLVPMLSMRDIRRLEQLAVQKGKRL